MRTVIALFAMYVISAVALAQQPRGATFSLQFEGNNVFSAQELLDVTNKCLLQNSNSGSALNLEALDYCLDSLKSFMFSKGYLRAAVGKPRKQQTSTALEIIVPVQEGILYRLGDVQVNGARLFHRQQLLAMLKMKAGDIADAEALSAWAYQAVKKMYAEHGYLQYTAELEPKYRDNTGGREGVVDLLVTVDEGDVFKLRCLKFDGNADVPVETLLREMAVRPGEVFNLILFEDSLKRINQTGTFETIDPDKDVDYRTDRKSPLLDITIHLKRKKS